MTGNMKFKQYDLSLIIPAYNEEKKIERDIREAYNFLNKSKIKSEIIISTDGVTDQTNNIVKKLQKEFKDLILLAEKGKIGKGSAIKKGVEIAKGDLIMFADAGLCVPYRFIKDGVNKIETGYDCAFASRASKKSLIARRQPLYRRVGSRLFGLLIHTFVGIPNEVQDTQCGFKIFKKKAAKDLFANLKTNGFMFDIEIILRAKKVRYKLTQFPVEWSNDADTKFDPFSGSIKILKELYKIKFLYGL